MERQGVSELRALAHPLRVRMLSLLTGTAMSAAEVARALDVSHANASYHLRRLADAGLVGEAGEERVRGGLAKRYRYLIERPPATSSTTEERLALARASHAEVLRRIPQHAGPGRPGNFTDLETWVQPEVWARAVALLEEASLLLHERAQPADDEGTVHVSVTVQAFTMRDTP